MNILGLLIIALGAALIIIGIKGTQGSVWKSLTQIAHSATFTSAQDTTGLKKPQFPGWGTK